MLPSPGVYVVTIPATGSQTSGRRTIRANVASRMRSSARCSWSTALDWEAGSNPETSA